MTATLQYPTEFGKFDFTTLLAEFGVVAHTEWPAISATDPADDNPDGEDTTDAGDEDVSDFPLGDNPFPVNFRADTESAPTTDSDETTTGTDQWDTDGGIVGIAVRVPQMDPDEFVPDTQDGTSDTGTNDTQTDNTGSEATDGVCVTREQNLIAA